MNTWKIYFFVLLLTICSMGSENLYDLLEVTENATSE